MSSLDKLIRVRVQCTHVVGLRSNARAPERVGVDLYFRDDRLNVKGRFTKIRTMLARRNNIMCPYANVQGLKLYVFGCFVDNSTLYEKFVVVVVL